MSETILTKGWEKPKGLCDMCRMKPSLHWFGDTSVALCGSAKCAEENQRNWQQMLDDENSAEDAV